MLSRAAAVLLTALPLMAAGAPPQQSSEHLRQECYRLVNEQWARYRTLMEPHNCTQSFECSVDESHKYDACNAIR